ncbi:MAG: hypothetical protein PHN84_14150 [Desulfuromonadaceae bacterium]|nr:hypothetical protein [Desulfuromonadaceae bacterium]MDD2856754.1 hypothetical protein [Desulfuromonadaceae bacterium]
MSYILDALKKIEHEKNRKSSSGGRVNISGDLFNDRKKAVRKSGIRKIYFTIVIAAIVASGGTWYLMKGNNGNIVSARQVAPPMERSEVAPVEVKTLVPPSTTSSSVEEDAADEEVSDRNRSTTRKKQASSQLKKHPVQTPPQMPHPVQHPIQLKPKPPTVQLVKAPADIQLSGIAWQDDRAGRRAVINGFLLKEGAPVLSSKVLEIKQDRVRFLNASGEFEIKLDSILPLEVGR